MSSLPPSVQLKLDLLFEGIRWTSALGEAADGALPNYYPYKFGDGEEDPTGTGQAVIPYLLDLQDDTLVRIKGNRESPYRVERNADGFELVSDDGRRWRIRFEAKPSWMERRCSDGTPMSQVGASLHGDMLVLNPAPGCQFFPARQTFGRRMRCAFCLYGKPAPWQEALGQKIDEPLLPDWTLRRLQETVRAALEAGGVSHVYLVGGSMLDPAEEAERYLQLARALREGCPDIPYLACGSGALPDEALETMYSERLVDGVCFNLEVFGADLFERVCPGKAHAVGYEGWIHSLEKAVSLWGRGHVYSAMVSGVELEPKWGGLTVEEAVARTLAGVEDLLDRGIFPILSLYWPLYDKGHERVIRNLRPYFARIHEGYAEVRRLRGVAFDPGFMCHRCSYMQLECDLDRFGTTGEG